MPIKGSSVRSHPGGWTNASMPFSHVSFWALSIGFVFNHICIFISAFWCFPVLGLLLDCGQGGKTTFQVKYSLIADTNMMLIAAIWWSKAIDLQEVLQHRRKFNLQQLSSVRPQWDQTLQEPHSKFCHKAFFMKCHPSPNVTNSDCSNESIHTKGSPR